jgi:hypothetical protein
LKTKALLVGGKKGKESSNDDQVDSSDVLVMCGPGTAGSLYSTNFEQES